MLVYQRVHMVVSINGDIQNVWFMMENPTETDEIWGYPYFRKPPCSYNYNVYVDVNVYDEHTYCVYAYVLYFLDAMLGCRCG